MSIFSRKLYSDVLYKKTYKNIIKMEFCFFIYLNDFEKKQNAKKSEFVNANFARRYNDKCACYSTVL